ncbi:Smr/MutS family protein [Luteimonas sp. RD2P54]|uniref:Smr/MutS family protein n=1 Tax=Luteimonas endophytica TaxID=3042023 RepID=A0ABT6JC44_9GAMM|nr:Smr/MutS family protein [Luteimonas endophytica]MDH5824396.1 Smr/MutS family protein [Luteimonas endophytica]
MTGRRPPPAEDEEDGAALFREAIGTVRRLPEKREPVPRPKPEPVPRMAERDEREARGEFQRLLEEGPLEAADSLRYRRDEISPRVLRRLARGQYATQDELDLHQAGAAQAEAWLRRFIAEARAAGHGCVRIVHGKGLHADGAPALKNLVDRLLRQRADVLAFHSAPAAQGGTGAVLVLLRPR